MLLQEAEIFNFKSIKDEKLKLNRNQHCFVGINECGKSSIIEAISYLNVIDKELSVTQLNKSSVGYPNSLPIISGIFSLDSYDYSELIKLFDQFNIKINGFSNSHENLKIQLKRWGNGFNNLKLTISDLETFSFDLTNNLKEKAKFLDLFFNSIYPVIDFYSEEELLIEPATVNELKGTDKRFETFRRVLSLGGCSDFDFLSSGDTDFIITYLFDINHRLNQIFKKHYRQDDSISLYVHGYAGKLTLVIRDRSQKTFSINERSPGFQYYFSFLVNKLYLNSYYKNRSIIYLLDEPGHNLHPKGAKDLLNTFLEVSGKSQILYTTHNPFLSIRNDIDSLIYVQKTQNEGTKINRKPYKDKYQILRKELGILLNDSFLVGDANLIVEGSTEKLAMHRLFQEEGNEELQWLNIYNADGVTNVSQSLNFLGHNNLNLSGIVLFDSDEEAKKEKTKKGYVAAMKSSKWASVEVNDVFTDKDKKRTFEDLFPQELYVKSFNDYCRGLKDVGVFDKEYTDYNYAGQMTVPVIKTLEEHFFSFIDNTRQDENSITKQDVIRILLDKIEKLNLESKVQALSKVNDLIKIIKEKLKKLN